jgi:hypothetical protein
MEDLVVLARSFFLIWLRRNPSRLGGLELVRISLTVTVTVTVTVGAYFTYKDLCSNQWPQYYPRLHFKELQGCAYFTWTAVAWMRSVTQERFCWDYSNHLCSLTLELWFPKEQANNTLRNTFVEIDFWKFTKSRRPKESSFLHSPSLK